MTSRGEDIEQNFIPASPDVEGKIDILHPTVKLAPKEVDPQDITNYLLGEITDKEKEQFFRLFLENIRMPQARRAFSSVDKKLQKSMRANEDAIEIRNPSDNDDELKMQAYQPLQLLMRCSFRSKEEIYNFGIVGVTPHYIFMCSHENNMPECELVMVRDVHVMEIKKMYYGMNFQKTPFFMVRMISRYLDDEKIPDRITFTMADKDVNHLGERAKCLARFVYRNVRLAYSTADKKAPTLESEDKKAFPPEFNSDLSPAQQFQFTYDALCSYENVPYNHEIVRYFHYQIVNHNGIFNAGYLPLDYSEDSSLPILREMIPIFRALIYVEYVFAVVCDHMYRPEIFKAVSFQLIQSSKVRFLHLSYCGAKTGLSDLANSMKQNPKCKVQYFDFSGNEFNEIDKDFQSFFSVFNNYSEDVIYFNFNFCKLKDDTLKNLFVAMKDCKSLHNLKYLHIAESKLTERPQQLLREFLSVHMTLKSLDIGKIKSDIEPIIKMLSNQPIECLYLYNTQISKSCFNQLISLIDKKSTLCTLDVSETGITPNQVSRIVDSMSSRFGYRKLNLKLNRLKLNGNAVVYLTFGFLNGHLDRWEKLSLESNGMKKDDLKLLIPLLHQMVNLNELSLSGNFDYTMPEVEFELCNILRIPSLKKLHLAGDDVHYLGPKGRPLLLAIALSYVLRKYIGGHCIGEKLPVQDEFSKDSLDLLLPHLETYGPPESKEFSGVLKDHLSSLMVPFIVEKRKENARTSLNREAFRKILDDLMPLIRIVGSSINCSEPSGPNKKRIGSYTMRILSKWRSITDRNPLADDSGLADELFGVSSDTGKSWLDMAADLAHLEELDLRNNKIKLSGINAICELLKVDLELKGVEIDGCDMGTVTSIVDFVDVVCEQHHLTRMSFPVKDMYKLIRVALPSAKQIVRRDLQYQQNRMVKAIDRNRANEGEFAHLPFDPIPEIQQIIHTKTSQMESKLPSKTLRTHNGICEDFRRQLVFLEADKEGFLGLPDDYRIQDIDRMFEYANFNGYLYKESSLFEKSIAMKKRFDEEYREPSQQVALKNLKSSTLTPSVKGNKDVEVQVPDETMMAQQSISLRDISKLLSAPKLKITPNFIPTSVETEIDFETDTEPNENYNDEKTQKAPAFNKNSSYLDKPDLYGRQAKTFDDENSEDEEDNFKLFDTNWKKLKGSLLGQSGHNHFKFDNQTKAAPPPPS